MNGAVAIVDYDCMCPAGVDVDSAWNNLANNGSGIGEIDRFDPSQETLQGISSIVYGGQIPMSFDEIAGSPEIFRKWCEPGHHAVKTLGKRIFDRLDFNICQHDPQRIGLLGATVLTSQLSREALARTGHADSKFILNQCQNIPLAATASQYGIQGPCFSVSSACASSGHAIFLAYQFIRGGLIDAALIVGYEFPIVPCSVGGLTWVSALYRRDEPTDRAYSNPGAASRPFSRDRRGFVLAEGAGAVFLCDAGYANKMGWPIKGTIKGGYMNSDADHLTRASTANVAACMEAALKASECEKDDIDCINAHSTSTTLGDATEMGALHRVFGERLKSINVVANKSQIGHSLGAAAILAVVLTVHGMRAGVILPTLNYIPDPALPEARICPEATEQRHERTLLNAFGFGGTNICLVLQREAA